MSSNQNGKCVFILGAGASAEAGAPLMASFLDRARNLIGSSGLMGFDEQSFNLVFRAISQLQLAHSKSQLDIHNLEPVFSAFEMAALFDRELGSISKEDVKSLPDAMRTLIVRTLEESIAFGRVPMSSENSLGIFCPGGYQTLAELLKKKPSRYAVITFNYDLLIDISLLASGVKIDYGLGPFVSPNSMPLLKLHGSMNWKLCKCGDVHAVPLETVLGEGQSTYGAVKPWDNTQPKLKVCISQGKNFPPQCNKDIATGAPFIVPPTWNKGVSYTAISPVWAAAARELSEAEVIVVIGYSMPETDQFFRYLYGLGTIGERIIRRFILVDPDKNGDVENRFRIQLGSAVLDRFKPITGPDARFGHMARSLEREIDIHRMG